MAALLAAAEEQLGGSAYLRLLLAACSDTARTSTPGDPPARGAGRRRQDLAERLSDRELDVLRLLATDLDGPAIARHLVVSLNTVRTHSKNIYAKLGVNSRRSAVRRADELGLLSRTARH